MDNISKLKLTKIKERPLSCFDKKYSSNKIPLSFSQKIPEIKTPFIIIHKNNNENLNGNLTERKMNNDIKNLSYNMSLKEKNYFQSTRKYRKIEVSKKPNNDFCKEKKLEKKCESNLLNFFVIENESFQYKRDINSKFFKKDKSKSRLSSASTYNEIKSPNNNNFFHKKIKNYNSFNMKINSMNKKGYNKFNNYKRDIIKKRMLKNFSQSKQNNNNNEISFDSSKTNSHKILMKNSSITQIFSDINENSHVKEKIDIDINSIGTNSIKIKNKYIIKFAKIIEVYKKFSCNLDFIRIDYRNNFLSLLNNLLKRLEEYNNYILYKYQLNKILSIEVWSTSLKSFYDFCEHFLKLLKMMIEEIRFNKKENIFLNKKLFQIENELNLKDKEIRDINKNIIKYDLNKIKNGQSAVEQVEKMKKNYIKKESKYVLTIYQMENELKQLSELLNKNEIDKKSLEELKTKYHLIKDELDKNKADFKEYEFQNEKKLILLTQYNSELSQKINNLENEIKFAKKKENEYAEQIIVHKSKIDYLNKIINQKEISLSQLKTEIKKLTELQMDKKLEIANTIFVPNK